MITILKRKVLLHWKQPNGKYDLTTKRRAPLGPVLQHSYGWPWCQAVLRIPLKLRSKDINKRLYQASSFAVARATYCAMNEGLGLVTIMITTTKHIEHRLALRSNFLHMQILKVPQLTCLKYRDITEGGAVGRRDSGIVFQPSEMLKRLSLTFSTPPRCERLIGSLPLEKMQSVEVSFAMYKVAGYPSFVGASDTCCEPRPSLSRSAPLCLTFSLRDYEVTWERQSLDMNSWWTAK